MTKIVLSEQNHKDQQSLVHIANNTVKKCEYKMELNWKHENKSKIKMLLLKHEQPLDCRLLDLFSEIILYIPL